MARSHCQETQGIKQQTKTDEMKESNWIQIGFISVADCARGQSSVAALFKLANSV